MPAVLLQAVVPGQHQEVVVVQGADGQPRAVLVRFLQRERVVTNRGLRPGRQLPLRVILAGGQSGLRYLFFLLYRIEFVP